MKYLLTIVLAVSSITIAQDAPQIPGWVVYVGGAMNGIAVDPDPEGMTYGRELNMPFVGVSRGIQIPGFPIPLLVGGCLGMHNTVAVGPFGQQCASELQFAPVALPMGVPCEARAPALSVTQGSPRP